MTLYEVCLSGDIDLVKQMLLDGYSVSGHAMNEALGVSLDMVMLLDKYADPSIKNEPLGWLINIDFDALKYLHNAGYNLVNEEIIKSAFCECNLEMLKYLLDIGNVINEDSLKNRIYEGLNSNDVIDFLKLAIEYGANPINDKGMYNIFSTYYGTNVVDFMLSNGNKLCKRCFINATRRSLGAVEYVLKKNPDLISVTNEDLTVCNFETYIYLVKNNFPLHALSIKEHITISVMNLMNEKKCLNYKIKCSIVANGTVEEIKHLDFLEHIYDASQVIKNTDPLVWDYIMNVKKYSPDYYDLCDILHPSYQNVRSYWLKNTNDNRIIEDILKSSKNVEDFKYCQSIGFDYSNIGCDLWNSSEEITLYNMNNINCIGENIFESICWNYDIPIIQKFIDRGNNPINDAATAACVNDIEKLKFMISMGNNINSKGLIVNAIQKCSMNEIKIIRDMGCSFINETTFKKLGYGYEKLKFMIDAGNDYKLTKNDLLCALNITSSSLEESIKILDLLKNRANLIDSDVFTYICQEVSAFGHNIGIIDYMIELGNDANDICLHDYHMLFNINNHKHGEKVTLRVLSYIDDHEKLVEIMPYIIGDLTSIDIYKRREFSVIQGELYTDNDMKGQYYEMYLNDTAHLKNIIKKPSY